MTRELTTLEVLQIAEEMERSAAAFYCKAAGLYRDPSLSKLFSQLARWEKGHVQVFASLKERFSGPAWEAGRSDLDPVNATRFGVPPAVFDARSDPARELTGGEARADVLQLALQKEQYTIGYYVTLTECALGEENLKAIQSILQEEKQHVRILTQSLQQAGG